MNIDIRNTSRADWLKLRQKGIGGSDAGAICGLNPYKSPVEVWAEKTADQPKEIPDNEAMRLGRDLEDYVAKRFEETTGKKVRRKNQIVVSDEFPHMIANVDRVVVGENALLECKTASPYSKDKWADGKCPESYEVQCHHYMSVTGADKVYLACLILGQAFEIVEINRDEEVIQNLRSIESDFWNAYVKPKKMPPPDGSESAGDMIREMYPDTNGGAVVDLSDMVPRIARYDELIDLIDRLKAEAEQIKQEIQLEMKDAETAWIGERKVTWKTPKQSYSIDEKRLKEEVPDIYELYKKLRKVSRRFAIAKR